MVEFFILLTQLVGIDFDDLDYLNEAVHFALQRKVFIDNSYFGIF